MPFIDGDCFSRASGNASSSNDDGYTNEATEHTVLDTTIHVPTQSTSNQLLGGVTGITQEAGNEEENNAPPNTPNSKHYCIEEDVQVPITIPVDEDVPGDITNHISCEKNVVIQTMPSDSMGILVRNTAKHAVHKEHREALSLPSRIELYSTSNSNMKIQRIVYPNVVTSAMMRKLFPKDMDRCKGTGNCPYCRGEEPKLVQGDFEF